MNGERYRGPTADEWRALLALMGLTSREAAELCAASPRTFRKYQGGQAGVPFAVLYTVLRRWHAGRHVCIPSALKPHGWRAALDPAWCRFEWTHPPGEVPREVLVIVEPSDVIAAGGSCRGPGRS